MPFFDLIIRWVESSDFGPKSNELGHRILKSDFIPSDFAKRDCISRPIFFFSDRKINIISSESDRIINGLRSGWDLVGVGAGCQAGAGTLFNKIVDL